MYKDFSINPSLYLYSCNTPALHRASDNSRKKKSNFARFLGDKIAEKLVDFAGISREFSGKLGWKAISKQTADFRFCPDQTSVFNVFLAEDIISSFNNNTL